MARRAALNRIEGLALLACNATAGRRRVPRNAGQPILIAANENRANTRAQLRRCF
jgi:hypothetical protein